MPDTPSLPVWYELIADDPDAAQRFYGAVIGWSAADSGMPGMDYRLLSAPDGAQIAGLMKRPEGMEPGPVWLPYFGVADVDATADAITAAGGTVQMRMDVPGVGPMAMATDPQDHPFYVMRDDGDPPSSAFRTGEDATPGHAVWNELTAQDQDAALGFYGPLLGWRHDGAMPMGPLGDYKFIHAGDAMIGATMNEIPNGRRGWQAYFHTDDIDAALARLKAAGGTSIQGPDQIPGGHYAVVAEDLEGVRFGLVGPRTQGEQA